MSEVNITNDSILERSVKFGVTKANINQAADKFAKTAESALKKGKYLFTIGHTLAEGSLFSQEITPSHYGVGIISII